MNREYRLNLQRTTIFTIICLILIFLTAPGGPVYGQGSTAPLITAQDANGRVVSPGSAATLTVLATDRNGTPLSNTPVTFASPAAGPSGSFPLSTTPQQRYMRG